MLLCRLRSRATSEHIVKCLVTAHRRVYASGSDGVDINIVGRQFDSKRLHETENPMLSGNIVSKVRHAFLASRRRNTDYLTLPPGKHLWDAYLASDPYTFE